MQRTLIKRVILFCSFGEASIEIRSDDVVLLVIVTAIWLYGSLVVFSVLVKELREGVPDRQKS